MNFSSLASLNNLIVHQALDFWYHTSDLTETGARSRKCQSLSTVNFLAFSYSFHTFSYFFLSHFTFGGETRRLRSLSENYIYVCVCVCETDSLTHLSNLSSSFTLSSHLTRVTTANRQNELAKRTRIKRRTALSL